MKTILIILLCSFAAQAQNAKIYFIRDTGYVGSALDFKEFIDGKIVCILDRKSYSIHEVAPGEHSVTWQANGKELKKQGEETAMRMNMEAEKVYYFKLILVQKFMSTKFDIEEITESSAKKAMAELKEDTNCFK